MTTPQSRHCARVPLFDMESVRQAREVEAERAGPNLWERSVGAPFMPICYSSRGAHGGVDCQDILYGLLSTHPLHFCLVPVVGAVGTVGKP